MNKLTKQVENYPTVLFWYGKGYWGSLKLQLVEHKIKMYINNKIQERQY